MRILITDGMDRSAIAQLQALGHEVVEQFYEPDALGAALRDFDAVVVRSITEAGTTWGGVPARKLSDNDSHSNLSKLLF